MIWMDTGPRITMNTAGKEEEDEREDELDGRLCRRFLRPLPAPRPQGIGVDPQGLGEARPQPLRLDQHGDEGFHVLHAGPVRQRPQRLRPRFPRHHLPVDDVELLAQDGAGELELLGDLHEGGS